MSQHKVTEKLQWEDKYLPGSMTKRHVYFPGLDEYTTESPEGWKATVIKDYGQHDWDDPAKASRWLVKIVMPDEKLLHVRTFYTDLKVALDFAEESYQKWLRGELKDESNFKVAFYTPGKWRKDYQATLFRVLYKGQREPTPVFTTPDDLNPQRVLDALLDFLRSRRLDPKKIVVWKLDGVATVVGPRGLDRYVQKLQGQTPEPLPSVGSEAQQIEVLEKLLRRMDDPFVQEVLTLIRQGKKPSDEQMKGIRFRLYRSGFKPDADMFRTAASRLAQRYLSGSVGKGIQLYNIW